MSKQVSKDWLEREKSKILNRIKSGELQTIKGKIEKDIKTEEANKPIPLKFPLLSEQEAREFNGESIQDNQPEYKKAVKETNENIKQQPKKEHEGGFFRNLFDSITSARREMRAGVDIKRVDEELKKGYKKTNYLNDLDDTEKSIKKIRENSDYDKTTDYYLEKTYRLHHAPKKNDGRTGIGNFLEGATERAVSPEFASMGTTEYANSKRLLDASEDYIKRFEKLRNKYESDEQTAQAVLEQMPKVYKNRLLAYTLYQEEQDKQNGKISNWYQGGQVLADMLPFAAQLGVSKAIIQSGMGALLKAGGKKILKEGTQEALKKTLSKQIGKKAVKTIGTDIATAGMNTAISPMTQKAKAEDYANIRLFENRDITGKDKAKIYTQQAIENLSETIGGDSARWLVRNGAKGLRTATGRITSPLIKKTIGKIGNFADTPIKWAKAVGRLRNNPAVKFLHDGAYIGNFGEEWAEELEGSIANSLMGYLFDDEGMKEEFSNFWSADNQSVLAISMAPMTIFPMAFGIPNAITSHRDMKHYRSARENLINVLDKEGLSGKNIVEGVEGSIIEGEFGKKGLEVLAQVRQGVTGGKNVSEVQQAIENYIIGASKLDTQTQEINARLQNMSNAERKQYVDDIIEGIHRQGKNNILYNGVKAGYYFELDNPQTRQKEKYVSEVVNKDGNSIGFIIDKKQNEDGEVVFTIRDGLGKDREMTLQEVYKQAEGGKYANNPILFTKVDDIYDYLTEQAGEDVELRTEIETRKLLSDYIQTQEDGSRVVRIAQLTDGSTMFVRAENEQAGTITGLVVTENGYKVEQRSIKEVETIGNRDADQIISNSANIFASSIEADANIDNYTNNEYEREDSNNNEVEQTEAEGNDQTQEEVSDNRNPREREHKLRERTRQQVENIYNQKQENVKTEKGKTNLTKEEAEEFIINMEQKAESVPEMELTPENWEKEFGQDGMIETPIGRVKMGENQYLKLAKQGREGKLGMIKPTLTNPDVIIEDESKAKEGDIAERESSYIFVKAFKKEDGTRYYYFTSVTVMKDNKEVVISNQEKGKGRILNLLQKGKILWKYADNISVTSDKEQDLYSNLENKTSDSSLEGTDASQSISKGKGSINKDNGERKSIKKDEQENFEEGDKVRIRKRGEVFDEEGEVIRVDGKSMYIQRESGAIITVVLPLNDKMWEIEKEQKETEQINTQTKESTEKQNDKVEQPSSENTQEKEQNETEKQVENIYNQEQESTETGNKNNGKVGQTESNNKEQEEVSNENNNENLRKIGLKESQISNKLDQNLIPFIVSPNGNIDFGYTSKDENLPEAPIRLSLGTSENGYIHINNRHGEEIRKAGFNSILDFIVYVLKHKTRIVEGNSYDNNSGTKNKTYLIQVVDKHNHTLYIQLSRNGKYWNINSAGVFSKKYGNKNKEVWSVSAQQNNVSANVSDDLRSDTKADKVSNPNVQSSILSDGKGTIKNGNDVEIEQEKEEENSGVVAIRRRYDRADKRIGRQTTKILPNGEKVRGRFIIVEAEGLAPSHDIGRNFAQTEGFPTREDGSTLNDRDYQHDKSAQQQVMTRSLKYDGRAVQDMPIIDKNGIVLSGNDRTMSGQLASKQGTDTEYLDYLVDNAEMYGLTEEQVKGMNHPRLVFELEENMPYTVQSFAIFNANERKTQNNTEKAIKVGKTISEKTITMIAQKFDEYESIAECLQDIAGSKFVVDRLVEDGILQRNDVEGMVNESGLLNATGKEFVQTALLGIILNEESIRIVGSMPFIRNIILSSLNEILQNRKLSDRYSLNQEINEAIKVVYEAHKNQKIKRGEALTLYYSQIDMFTGESNMKEITIQLLVDILNGEKVKELKKVLSLYNVDALSADSGELDMFGLPGSVKTKEQILKEVIKRIKENEQRKSNAQIGRVSNGDIKSKESGGVNGTESANERERSGHKSQRDNRERVTRDERGGQQREVEDIKPIGKGEFGNIYDQFKGKVKEAVEFLLKHKNGDLLGVFHRKEVGDIDLVWGDDKRGLSHIIEKHVGKGKDFENTQQAITIISDVIEKGNIIKEKWDKLTIEYDGKRVVISKNVRDDKGGIIENKNWVVTSFDNNIPKSSKKESSSVTTRVTPDNNKGSRAVASDEVSNGKGTINNGNSITDEARRKIKERLNKLQIKGIDGLSLEEYYKQAVEKGAYFEKNMTESGKWEYRYYENANTFTIITKAEYDYALSIGGKHEPAELKDLLIKEREYNRLANKYEYKDAEDIMLSMKNAEKQGLEANEKELWEYYELAKSYDKWSKRLQNYYTYYISNHFKEVEKEQEIKPIGKGEFGNIYDQFKGKVKEAVEFLKEKKEGEVLEALYHKDVGHIDLVWGKEGTAKSDGYGLSKLIKYHPEVVDNLQEIINDMHITKRTENRIQLESDKYKASVRLTWNNERKTWLLTAFQKNSVSDNTTDTDETLKGKRNATATSQNTISNGKGTIKNGTDKEKSEKDFVNKSFKYIDEQKGEVYYISVRFHIAENDTYWVNEYIVKLNEQGNNNKKDVKWKNVDSIKPKQMSEAEIQSIINKEGTKEVIIEEKNEKIGRQRVIKDKEVKRKATKEKAEIKKQKALENNEHKVSGEAEQTVSSEEAQLRNAVVGVLSEAIGKENVITDNAEAQRVLDEENGKVKTQTKEEQEKVNERFNEELDKFEQRKMRSSDKFDLGQPSDILIASGLNASEITMTQSVLKKHLEKHGLTTQDIKNLPNAIQNPIMVYEWGTKSKNSVIITSIPRGNERITVSIRISRNGKELQVNEISSVHGKSIERLIKEINTPNSDFAKDNLKYVNKKEVLDWFAMETPLVSSQTEQELLSVAKILQNFENPQIKTQKTNLKQAKRTRGNTLYGGNSGYVGYSISKRGAEAKEEGRFPKTEFKKEYNMPQSTLDGLVAAGIITNNEWHHTSVYGNKTTFYGWKRDEFAEIYAQNKKAIDEFLKNNQKEKNPYTYHTDFSDEYVDFIKQWSYYERAEHKQEINEWLDNHPEDKAKKEENKKWDEWNANSETPIEYGRRISEQLKEKFFTQELNNEQGDVKFIGIRFFRTQDGEAYGFTSNGKVYIDTSIAKADTPIHEYTHLWAEALRELNPKEWANIVSLMKKETHLWEKIRKDYPELTKDDDIAEEVLAHYSGANGLRRLEEEAKKIKQDSKQNIFDRARALQAIKNVKEALNKFWHSVADFLHIHYTTAQEVADRVLSDLLNGVNPNEILRQATAKNGKKFGEVKTNSNKKYNAEEQAIIDNAKANGTYMKAPNGKPTNLTAKQWVQVRTKAFKEWFGDWEKSARIEKLRKSESIVATGEEYKGKYELNNQSAEEYIRTNLRKEYTNKDTGDKIKITRTGAEKVTRHDAENEIHLKSIALIPQMLENAIFITEETNEKEKRGFDSYKYYVVGLKIGNIDYTAKLVVGVKNGQTYYDHALTEISKEKLLDESDMVKSHIYHKENFNGKDTRLFSIIRENSSKVVDENGEPLVVYHGTLQDFNTFDINKAGNNTKNLGIFGKGFYFSNEQTTAQEYIRANGNRVKDGRGNIIDGYLNIKNPVIWSEKDKLGTLERLKEIGFPKTRISYNRALPLTEANEINIFTNNTKKKGYDGVIYSYDNNHHEFVIFEPNQIKSATDNTGEYSRDNNDIRVSKKTNKKTGYDVLQIDEVNNRGNDKLQQQKIDSKVEEVSDEEAELRDVLVETMQEAGIEVVTDSKDAQRVLDKVNGKDELNKIDEVNNKFNEELNKFEQGKMRSSDKFDLGQPSNILIASGLNASEITMTQSVLKKHLEKHGIDISELKDLVKAINNPMLVYEWGTKAKSTIVITNLTRENGDKITVAIRLLENGQEAEINEVTSVHGKAGGRFISDMLNAKQGGIKEALRFVQENRKEVLDWLAMETPKVSSQTEQELLSIAKVVENFENPPIKEGKSDRNNFVEHRVYHGSGAEFTEFDHSHMGEGEGQQAYGWGTYVTEVNGIAREYATTDAERKVESSTYKGVRIEFAHPFEREVLQEIVIRYVNSNGRASLTQIRAKYITELENHKRASYNRWKEAERDYNEIENIDDFDPWSKQEEYQRMERWRMEYENTDSYLNIARGINEKELRVNAYSPILYSVEIPDDNGRNYIYYENALNNSVLNRVAKAIDENSIAKKLLPGIFSKSTSKKIKDLIKERRNNKRWYDADLISVLGSMMGSPKKASKIMRKAGYVGISYPAQYRSGGRKDGARNYVIFDEKDLKIVNKIRLFKTSKGEVYGFVKDEKVYIDTSIAKADTPIHEYTHLWARALREYNPQEWANIVSLLKKEKSLWEYVKQMYPELTEDNDIADEVLAHYSGKRGAERLRQAISEVKNDKTKSVFDRARIIKGLQNVKEALNKFWQGVADFLHIHYTTAEEVADRVLYDMLNKMNPNDYINNNKTGKIQGQRQYNAEEQAIIDKAKAEGTYMKAPNGKPTNLTAKQWVQVRTKAFKEWFGDWEKSARIDKLRKSESISITGEEIPASEDIKEYRKNALEYGKKNVRGEYVNKDTNTTIQVGVNSLKEILHHNYKDIPHIQSIVAIPQIIENAIYIDTEVNENSNKPNITFFDYYVCGLKIDGEDYTVKAVIVNDKDGIRYYDHKLTQIEKGRLLAGERITSPIRSQVNNLSDGKDTRLFSIIRENSSKVVDKNGEPLVVYHGTTNGGFSTFGNSYMGGGYYFTDNKDIASNYSQQNKKEPFLEEISNNDIEGIKRLIENSTDNKVAIIYYDDGSITTRIGTFETEGDYLEEDWDSIEEFVETMKADYALKQRAIYPVFLNIRNSENINVNGSRWNAIKQKEFGDRDFKTNEIAFIVKNKGNNDGVIFSNIKDGVFGDKILSNVFVVFEPNQIKSATDNTGAFSKGNNDIRFRMERQAEVEISREDKEQNDRAKERVLAMIGKAGVEVEVNTEQELLDKVAEVDDKAVEVLQSVDGELFGFVYKGKIYINSEVGNTETLLHEWTHLWDISCRRNNSELWERGKALMKQTPLWAEIRAREEYSELSDDELASEIHARLVGKEGERLLRQMQQEALKNGDNATILKRQNVLYKLKEWLRSFWQWVKGTQVSGVENMSLEEFISMPIAELVERSKAKEIDKVNNRFNKELQQQIDDTLAKDHTYQLGRPSEILQSAGIPNLPIELKASRLNAKSKQDNHPFELENVRDLVKALQKPLAIFEYGDKTKAQNIIVEIQKEGKNFLVGISINPLNLQINVVRGLFPKETAGWLNWMSQDKALYLDKKRIQTLIDQQRTNLADVEYLDLNSVAKVVENFEKLQKAGEKNIMMMSSRRRRADSRIEPNEDFYIDAKEWTDTSGSMMEGDNTGETGEQRAGSVRRKTDKDGLQVREMYSNGIPKIITGINKSGNVETNRWVMAMQLRLNGGWKWDNEASRFVRKKQWFNSIDRWFDWASPVRKLVTIVKLRNENLTSKNPYYMLLNVDNKTDGLISTRVTTKEVSNEMLIERIAKESGLSRKEIRELLIINSMPGRTARMIYGSIEKIQEKIDRNIGTDTFLSLLSESEREGVDIGGLLNKDKKDVILEQWEIEMITDWMECYNGITEEQVQSRYEQVIKRYILPKGKEAEKTLKEKVKKLLASESFRDSYSYNANTYSRSYGLYKGENKYDGQVQGWNGEQDMYLMRLYQRFYGTEDSKSLHSPQELKAKAEELLNSDKETAELYDRLLRSVEDGVWEMNKFAFDYREINEGQWNNYALFNDKYWLPLRGWDSEYYKAFGEDSDRQRLNERERMRGRIADDPLKYFYSEYRTLISDGVKNEAKRSLVEMIEDNAGLFTESDVTANSVQYCWRVKDEYREKWRKRIEWSRDKLPESMQDGTYVLTPFAPEEQERDMGAAVEVSKGILMDDDLNRLHFVDRLQVFGEEYDVAYTKGREGLDAYTWRFKDGEVWHKIVLPDKTLVSILNSRNMKPKATSLKVMQKIAKVTRFMARMMTSRNITFLFRNFIRDYQEALFVEVPGMRNYRKNFNKYVWQDKKVLFDIINKPKDTQEKIYTLREKSKQEQLTDKERKYLETYKLYNEWLEMGGSTGVVHELSSINANLERMRSMIEGNRLQRLLGRQIDSMENAGLRNMANAIVKGKIWNVLAKGVSLKYVEQLAEVTENLVRFASYRAFRQEGMNKLESAYQSREATVNFSRWGNFSKTMNMLFPFFSATMNALYRDARLLVHNPSNFMKRAGMYFALGGLNVLVMSLIGGDDDDDKNKYKYVSDYMKYRGMYIPVPYLNNWFIPVSQSCYPIYALGVLSAQCVTEEKTKKEALVEWLNMLLDMSPESLGRGIKNITKYNKATDKIELNNGEDILYSVAGGLTSGVGNVFFDLAKNENYLGGRIINSDSGFGKEYHKTRWARSKDNSYVEFENLAWLYNRAINYWMWNLSNEEFDKELMKTGGEYVDKQGKLHKIHTLAPEDVQHIFEGILPSYTQPYVKAKAVITGRKENKIENFPIMNAIISKTNKERFFLEANEVGNDLAKKYSVIEKNISSMNEKDKQLLKENTEYKMYKDYKKIRESVFKQRAKKLSEIDKYKSTNLLTKEQKKKLIQKKYNEINNLYDNWINKYHIKSLQRK